ncbi:MAG: hypothetical protein ABW168_04675 [Sedimenticola sp.]
MNGALAFPNTPEGWRLPLDLYPWSLYIYGGERALEAEGRCREGFDRFAPLPNLLTVGVARRTPSRHAHFLLRCGNKQEEDVTWSQLAEVIGQCLQRHGVTSPHIVFDITSLELDTILYLMPQLLELRPATLQGLYLVPKEYVMKTQGLILQPIQQPRGYVSFDPGLEGARQAHHYIITGFDVGRAERFIDAFDWGWERLHGVIGDPSYVDNGFDYAWNANQSWLKRLEDDHPKNMHRIKAAGADGIRRFFQEEFVTHRWLDIVPLGPKPMLLGVLLFYLGLEERERARVRILFDFPTPRPGSTEGAEKGYLFDCRALLT